MSERRQRFRAAIYRVGMNYCVDVPATVGASIGGETYVNVAGEVAGTPPYMSPEQCTPGADLDLRSDIYSLGVVLYEILCGRLPHEVSGISIAEAARRIRETPPAPADTSLPADLRAILERAMARAPDRRYSSAAMLAADAVEYRRLRAAGARSWTQ